MEFSFKIVFVLVLILYLKWILVVFFYPFMVLSVIGSRQSKRIVRKIMRFPLYVLERISRYGGGEVCTLSNINYTVCTSPYMVV